MINPKLTIKDVKEGVKRLYKKPVTVRVDIGRQKFVSFPAVLAGVYPSIFTVLPEDKNFIGKTTFSFSEILCGKVSLTPRLPNSSPPTP